MATHDTIIYIANLPNYDKLLMYTQLECLTHKLEHMMNVFICII